MTIARTKDAGTIRLRMSDGKVVEFTFTTGQYIECKDALGAVALASQFALATLDEVTVQPAKIDHDADTKPRVATTDTKLTAEPTK